MTRNRFQSGVNLGGWLSQYAGYDTAHFDTFITERDIEQIAGWGMDHIRLPIDYPVVLRDGRPDEWNEEGLAYADRCLEWARKRGLGVILDLHKAPGYSFGTLESNTLFTDETLQERFVSIWRMLASRYRSEGDNLQFELLNEMVDTDSSRWNRLAHRTIAAIRAIDRSRTIVYGGNYYNSVDELKHIDLVPDDDNIVYTFHMYKPMLFTHQKASWVPFLRELPFAVEYPGETTTDMRPALESSPEIRGFLESFGGGITEIPESFMREYFPGRMDRAFMEACMQPAADFIAETGRPLYCGEFGVIDQAPLESRIRWHADTADLFRSLGIGYAVWSYKEMSFGLVDADSRVISPELVRALSR